MYYALRRRIGNKEPILLYRGEMSYLFCSEGVGIVRKQQGFKFRSTMWTVIDAVNDKSGIPTDLYTEGANVLPIYLTSPRVERWATSHQFWRPICLIMNPWTRSEMNYA